MKTQHIDLAGFVGMIAGCVKCSESETGKVAREAVDGWIDHARKLVNAGLSDPAAEMGRLRTRVAELEGCLGKMVAAYDEILTSGLPAVVKASFAARCDGETARAALVRTSGGQEVGK